MSFELNHDNLLKYLNQHDLQPALQQETHQIYITLKVNEEEIIVFFGINPTTNLLQIVGYLPYLLHEKALGEVARMLHLLNKQLDMPGFGMDEKEKLLFYRCVIPATDGMMNKELLGMYLGTLRLACDTFMHVIEAVAVGSKKVDEFNG